MEDEFVFPPQLLYHHCTVYVLFQMHGSRSTEWRSPNIVRLTSTLRFTNPCINPRHPPKKVKRLPNQTLKMLRGQYPAISQNMQPRNRSCESKTTNLHRRQDKGKTWRLQWVVYSYCNPIHFTLKFPNVNFQPKLNICMPGPII